MSDGMPLKKRGKEDGGASAEVGGDRVSTLPDEILNHVLSLLLAEEAVRTCLLARRWRHLWKSSTGLRIGFLGKDEPKSVHELRRFVDYFLLLRGGHSLDTCEFRIGDFSGDEDVPRVNLWFRRAVMCNVRALKLHVHLNHNGYPYVELDDLPLISKTLTRLDLYGVRCHSRFLNFSSCPALEHLRFVDCYLKSAKISSESLKNMSIVESILDDDYSRTRVYAPNLVSLCLDDLAAGTPILESMPELERAFVRITNQCEDHCIKIRDPSQDCDCESCDNSDSIGDRGNNCVLLKGLSEAVDLVLISNIDKFIFKRDLRWCPTFNKLRTLLLNDYWCVPDDLHALACILEHSPNLERLTLLLFSEGPKHNVEMEGHFRSMVRSPAISKHLNTVQIKCEMVDERVITVLKFLCKFLNMSFSF